MKKLSLFLVTMLLASSFVMADDHDENHSKIRPFVSPEFNLMENPKTSVMTGMFKKMSVLVEKNTDKKKGYITPHHIEFILAWIKETIDLDQNELTIANRNLLINKKLKDQISNHLHIDELLSVLQGRIRHNEEGIVDIPFNMKRSEYSNYMAKLNS